MIDLFIAILVMFVSAVISYLVQNFNLIDSSAYIGKPILYFACVRFFPSLERDDNTMAQVWFSELHILQKLLLEP